ncbi:cytosolic 5'-nucleotidase 1A isoform X1 [Clupea harengus]|uniref:Cytosolic 5'-nucleotidase 1A isoform X1 n=1 Tax=Clupea harengus TaxID=7950 RepID=A0A6P8EYE3_CLUHA|nr:cytosolic 5'-nucleotidase 1A isoform X1 [Clupea harengus]XP_031421262.1 cytosolic 5'-nucleotidase 1A isoform X1 [Clupea harengus]XP_031421263.1 cytosolic 5'-nucleotidase 1A isoform X1 [Clupea harengus]
MESNIIINTDVVQMSASAIVIAVSCHGIFDLNSDTPTESDTLPKGVAFSFIKAIQAINEKLAAKNSHDPLFDLILVANDLQGNQSKVVSSTKHYGLQISRFCFCTSEDFTQSLQATNVNLYLSMETSDVGKALQEGVPAALLCPQTRPQLEGDEEQVASPLTVLLSGDVMGLPEEKLLEAGFSQPQLQIFRAAKASMADFAAVIGEMRRHFGREDSPLRVTLMSVLGSRDEWASALLTARGWGLEVDEAYCLAGASREPVLKCIQPHILCYDGLYNVTEVPALS